MRSDNKHLIGFLMLIVVSMFLFMILTNQNTITTASQIVKNTMEYDMGEKITIYELPDILSVDEQKALAKSALSGSIFQDILPQEYQNLALQQDEQRKISGQRDLLTDQVATPQQNEEMNVVQNSTSVPQGDVPSTYYTKTGLEQQSNVITGVTVSKGVGSRLDPSGVLESSVQENTWVRGEIVKFAGRIEKTLSPPPYFYNVLTTCCGMSSFRAQSGVETDSFGNFVVSIPTSGNFPLGQWEVTISTTGDDNKIIKHKYDFTLVAPPE